MKKNKTLQVLDAILLWAALCLVAAIPLFFWPRPLSTSYPLVWIYLLPKIVLLRLGLIGLESAAAILLLIHLVFAVRERRLSVKIGWADLSMVVFIGLLWVSAMHSLNRGQALYGSRFWLEGFYTYLNYAALFFIARIFGNGRALVKLAYILTVTTIFISLYAIVEAFYPAVQSFTNVGLTGRSGATAGNAVILGAYMLLPLALIGGLLAQRIFKGFWAVLAGAALWLGALAVFFTFSRGSWISLALVGFVLTIRTRSLGIAWTRKQQRAAAVLLLLAIAIMAVGPRPPQTVVARAFSAFNPSEPSIQTRLAAWGQAGRLIPRYPLWGTGIDNFAKGVIMITPRPPVPPMDKPHNFFLEVPVTMGIPAFAAFMAWLVLVFYAGVKAVRSSGPSSAAIFSAMAAAGAYLLALCFLFSSINNAPLFYVILGLIAAAARDAGTLPTAGGNLDLFVFFR